MAAKVLNIEICDQTISVCRTARKGKGLRVFDSFVFPTPEGCVLDGVISNPTMLANELRMQFASHGLQRAKNVIFSLSSSKIAVREVKLPPMKKKLIATAIKTNSVDYFPIDLKSYHITYSILDVATSSKPYSRVLVLAVPISMIEGYFLLAERAGLTIKAIDSSGNSQYQALKQLNLKGITVFADVGSTSSSVSFMRDGKLLLQRTFAFGAHELVSHYLSLSGKTRGQYLEALHETDITNPDFAADKLLSPADIQSDLERLVNGVMRSIDYFNSSQWDAPVSRVVLVGLNRHIVGIRDLIAEATGLETLYLDEIPDYLTFTNGSHEAPAFVNCIGCSLEPLDLVPKQFRPARRITVDDDDASVMPGVIMCCIIVVGAILISLSSWLGYVETEGDLSDIQAKVASLQSGQLIYDQYISYQDTESSIDALASLTDTPNSEIVSFVEELEQKMPSSILVLSASFTNDSVSLNITVGSFEEAASVISSLRGFDSLSQVDISDLSRGYNEAGSERISFSANCIYGVNPYLNQINPYRGFVNPSEAAAGETANASAGTPADSAAGDTSVAGSAVIGG